MQQPHDREEAPGLTELRTQLEGGYELLEQALAGYRSLLDWLDVARASTRLPLSADELQRFSRREDAVRAALEKLGKRLASLGDPADEVPRRLLAEVTEARGALEARLRALPRRTSRRARGGIDRTLEAARARVSDLPLVPLTVLEPAPPGFKTFVAGALGSLVFVAFLEVVLRSLTAALSILVLALSAGRVFNVALSGFRPDVQRMVWVGVQRERSEVHVWRGLFRPFQLKVASIDPAGWLVVERLPTCARLLVTTSNPNVETPEGRQLLRFTLDHLRDANRLAQTLSEALGLPEPRLAPLDPEH